MAKYRVEKTKRLVKAIGSHGEDATGVADVIHIWDDEEGIGLELPYRDIIADPDRGVNPFLTPEGKAHAEEVAKRIEEYARQNNIGRWEE